MMLLRDMGQSLAHLLVHAIFSTKDRRPFLHSEEIRNEIYAYMAGTLKNLDCHPIKIWRGRRTCSCLLFPIEEYRFLRFNWPIEGSFIKTPQKRKGSETLGGRMDTVPSPSASPTWNRSRPISSTKHSIIGNLLPGRDS